MHGANDMDLTISTLGDPVIALNKGGIGDPGRDPALILGCQCFAKISAGAGSLGPGGQQQENK